MIVFDLLYNQTAERMKHFMFWLYDRHVGSLGKFN